jgi:hypothetical protein
MANPTLTKNFIAGGTLSARLIVKKGADDSHVVAAAASTDAPVGVNERLDRVSGDRADIVVQGIADVLLGGTVNFGDRITADANGKGVAATSGSNNVGMAMADGVSGDIIPVLVMPSSSAGATFGTHSVNGAITQKEGIIFVTKAGVDAMTLAAPTAGTDDGKRLRIVSATAQAHTVTQTTPGFNNGSTASDVATFGGAIGDNMEIAAYNGVWHVLNLRNVTLG